MTWSSRGGEVEPIESLIDVNNQTEFLHNSRRPVATASYLLWLQHRPIRIAVASGRPYARSAKGRIGICR
jgi:hypothetical protein